MATKYNYTYDDSKVEEFKVQHKPWKVPFSPKITQANVGLYSLFDLFFYENGNTIYRRYAPIQGESKGTNLEHDIICYNNSIYNGNTVDRAKETYSTWATMGFDIGYVEFDPRAKYRTVTLKTVAESNPASGGAQTYGKGDPITVRVYDRDAALIPQTVLEMVTASSRIFGRYDEESVDNASWQNAHYKPYTVGSNEDAETYSSDIILCSPDTVFNNTLIGKEGYDSYNKICLNINNLSSLFYQSIIENSDLKTNETANFVTEDDLFGLRIVHAASIQTLFDENDNENTRNIIDVLKHTYVWVRCSFFGDYVKPDSFNQDLNQNADVRHGNLMISTTGDFNRYDDATSMYDSTGQLYTDEYLSKKTRPYLAQTAPSEDILSAQIAKTAGVNNYDQTKLSTLGKQVEALQKASEKDDASVIGSLWNDTLARDRSANGETVGQLDHLTPPMYFDTEANKDYELDYHVPVLVPKTGNIITDGRIVSPTIDEIWTYFKKLVSGHDADEVNYEGTKAEQDVGLIVNHDSHSTNAQDTRIKEGAAINWDIETVDGKLSTYKRGDPIELAIVPGDGVVETLNVKNWVAAPESFKMVVFDFLQKVSERATTFEGDYENGTYYLNNKVDSSVGSHDILNETAKDSNNKHIKNNDLITEDYQYGPRAKPYSLRELEAALKNVKYNLNTLMQYLFANYTVNSQLIKRTNQDTTAEDYDPTNRQASGLYQFHRDYNSIMDGPNTWFNKRTGEKDHKSITPKTGASAVFDDSGLNSYAMHNDSTKYGSADTLPRSSHDYSASDVYLAADGTWRYIFDHVRIPVMKTDY